MIPQTDATRALLADIDARNRTLHADAVLRERVRGLISDYLRPPGSGLPEPTADHPPRLAVGPTPTPTSGQQISTRRGHPGTEPPVAVTGPGAACCSVVAAGAPVASPSSAVAVQVGGNHD